MKKKYIIILLAVLLVIFTFVFFASGSARTDVYLRDFEVSSDGGTIKLKVGVASSVGYVRKMKQTSGSTNGYYTFYSTYGINSKIGAKDMFEIEIDKDTDEIYFYTGNNGYKLVLAKHKITDEWVKISYGNMKINLLNKEKINKVAINTGAQDKNYFEYIDKNIIEKIYNIFVDLETTTPSLTFNPESTEEMYSISFDTDEYKDKFEWSIEIYKKNNRYYVEQRYNGIYEIPEEDFNLLKNILGK